MADNMVYQAHQVSHYQISCYDFARVSLGYMHEVE
jgi:hypothetical protein